MGSEKRGERRAEPRRSRKRAGRPTIADVAAAAAVSSMTVSRVINSDPHVSQAARDKVEAAIAALGYVPNAAARSLAGGKACRIALIHSNPSAAYLSEVLVGALEGAAEHDAQLVVEPWNGGEKPVALARRLAHARIDAVLLPPPLCDDAQLAEALAASRLPFAQIATGAPRADALAVTIDDREAARRMTAHLIALGHSRIGFIAGNGDQTASELRLAGYRAALDEAGLAFEPALVTRGDFSYRSGLAAAEALLGLPTPPSAIFASNDDMAAAVIAAAHRRHLEVPQDLSVCGFDDSIMASMVWPEVTTVRQPVAEMARKAVAMLEAAVRGSGSDEENHARLGFELLVRSSDGPPPAR